ncbi:MAG: CoA pyrophosphatase [Moraxellaceae bacterium]|nr:CoA pyrophosphatase [Moraxellaceae bacterium]
MSDRKLQAQDLRDRFARVGGVSSMVVQADPADTSAGVLIPVVTHEAGLTVLLTRRTDHLWNHAGQISFPGGRVEPGDADAVAAALRETDEEVGIAPAQVEVLGRLPDFVTGTGFHVVPVVGLVAPPLQLKPDPFEVAEIFEVPLDFLLDERRYQRHRFERAGQVFQVHAVPWPGKFIWGATAGMLASLARCMAD